MFIFYHGDMDGIVAAHLYLKSLNQDGKVTLKLFQFEYDKEKAIYDIPMAKLKQEHIIFLDCCPSEDVLQYCSTKTKNLIVLDHHISKKELIDDFKQRGLLQGLSYIGASATLLVWCWVHFNKDIDKIIMFLDRYRLGLKFQNESGVPFTIKLINSWDIWDNLYSDAEAYKTYFETQNFDPLNEEIDELLEDQMIINKAIREGYTMIEFFHNWGQQYCERYGYEIFMRGYNFFVLNVGNANSKIFGDIIKKYDAVITYCNNGIKYTCSIYSVKDFFNCAEFAEQFGGGGHKGAAGFVFDELPIWLRDKKSGLVFKEDKRKNENK